jgi:adenine-specific DNA-methyltransferase
LQIAFADCQNFKTTMSAPLKVLKPKLALNKAFLKVSPLRSEIEVFKANLIKLIDQTNDTESEEFHKNLVSDFLKETYYKPNHFINTKGRNDLVIHNGLDAKSSVGVIIEAKKPTNKSEMMTTGKLNTKAFQELVLYYLRERITHKNLEVRHLIVSNISEWFIFDAQLFDRLFAQNKNLVNQFAEFEEGRLADTKTDFFYKQIAEPFIKEIETEIVFAYFNLKDYQKALRNDDLADDGRLVELYKLLSPEHLLKLPFANDSNSLDKGFYTELLHIIGLKEIKEGSKKIIDRNKESERSSGTLIEDTIIQLDSLDKIGRLDHPEHFGTTQEERLFNVALQLSITWINRILFLKLLEAQLISYHKGDKSYAFLSLDKIKNYDDLNSLFFQVLARKHDERNKDVKTLFDKVPYLNSSLFEPTELEHATLFISNLKEDKSVSILSQTVLKDQQGKKRTGNLSALDYLFEFLNAYNFSSEGTGGIREDNKTLINASVLGLIFEKINGYKDGSFFTPGFITMYMCRETIRKAVVQKFNEAKKWNCKNLDELYDKIEDRKEANEIVNSVKICDPAVGSGHFLVSALNEMIAVKHDLKIIVDRSGKRIKEYTVEVVNDELAINDEDGEPFEYNPSNKESQRIQEMLFHEKQTIIENCLFGVDINPNSVKICRLRLWIELLKNAYYKNETELETLPNIDINIKCGNSLISRFAIDADLKQALKKSKWSIESYRIAVDTYRNAQSKEQKREMERLITDIKSDFRTEIASNDPKVKKLYTLNGELTKLTTQQSLFEMSKKEKADWNKKLQQLTEETKN